MPGKFFAAAVRRGGAQVGLSNYATPTLLPGYEQTITLNSQSRITSAAIDPATFTTAESSAFDLQQKKGGGK
jgi:hypothetical protein